MPSSKPDYSQFHPKTRLSWRKWLEKNHEVATGVWLIYYKKDTGKRRLHYAEAVEEALCFGWIDSLPRKLDAERTMLKFTPRKPKSGWSELNKKRIEQLIKAKQMTKAGLLKIEQAKKNGSWDALTNSDQHANKNTLPAELEKSLKKNKKAFENFNAFPHSYRKRFFFWIDSAKKEETRKARIEQTILMAEANKKPGASGFKL
jgi:uncharacterized protein YdeI (YjbR/CyaY-like superfamily)